MPTLSENQKAEGWKLLFDGKSLDGQKIVDYELNSPDWKRRIEAGNWKDAKGYGQSAQGHIDFQDRGSEVWFKNVMIKSL